MSFGHHLGNLGARGVRYAKKGAEKFGEQASNLSESAKIAFDSSGISQTIGNIQTMTSEQLRQLLSFLESQITKVKEQINKTETIESMAETIRRDRTAAARGGKKQICNKISKKSKKSKKMKGGYTYKALSKSLSNASSEITGSLSSNSLSLNSLLDNKNNKNNKKTRKRKENYNTI
jgi:phage I-like protein